MDQFDNLISDFESISNWGKYVQENFERRFGIYTSVEINEIIVQIDECKFVLPRRIIFQNKYVKYKRSFNQKESSIVQNKKVKIFEKKKLIPFGYYKRGNKYTGDIVNILKDILGNSEIEQCRMSNNLLQLGDSPLFNLDSKIDWPVYCLVFDKAPSSIHEIKNDLNNPPLNDNETILYDVVKDYGFHFSFSENLKNKDIVFFKLPYLKIVENKIKNNDIDSEKLFLVIQFGEVSFLYNSKSDIKIKALIKDTKNEIVFDDVLQIEFEKASYQTVEIEPNQKSEIGYSQIEVYINNALVEQTSGYYIRSIKINAKIK